MKKLLFTIQLAFLAILIQSCGGEENLPAATQTGFELKAVTTQSMTAPGGRMAQTGVTFTKVLIGVTEIEFETLEEQSEEAENGGESEDEEVEFKGNFIVDLLTGTSNPTFGLSEIAPSVYEKVEIKFDNIIDGEKTLIAEFYYTPEGAIDPVFVEFSTSEELELEIENDLGFTLDEGAINSFLVTIDLDILFASVDLSTLVVSEDGVIRINEDSNADVMEMIVEQMEDSLDAEEEDEDDEEEEGDGD
ncbi:MAG: hypothetical protein RIC15_08385 [Vicingaceae bacterium]